MYLDNELFEPYWPKTETVPNSYPVRTRIAIMFRENVHDRPYTLDRLADVATARFAAHEQRESAKKLCRALNARYRAL
jgi:hypothetical protein